ncbi:RagB/SusD family nutrient uptake outer membrane protein [Plebeiobacterium marinum]|uniref:RagB/SusD family nutrient uptake outer membrane protein n=1 Tax=Plebeiibacterium marinum TaxID=2992111 RepID=A0AAE3SIM0_9BACT|nr:RagB/SusD family nutrient uptake outer membrane protein [Plebeiobacterium marinum]MCW3804578.1 RagB/SusD family nutrient uptake outer membrane protein [Plebeiobacterium marinum]
MKRNILFLLISLLVLSSCEDLFEPAIENMKDIDLMYSNPQYAQGVLVSGYRFLPDAYGNTEYATDDAVTNEINNSYLKMATGSWTASNNPVSAWNNSYGAIQYVNTFLENCDKVEWDEDEEAAELFNMRLKGEAYGLRGLYMYNLLKNHAGFSSNGELLGIPIVTSPQNVNSDFNQERATFQACVDQIITDLNYAIDYLPEEYVSVYSLDEVPEKYKSMVTSYGTYNRTMGDYFRQLIDGQIAKAFRSRVALLAASPAFQDGSNTTTWEDAAKYSADVLNYIGGISGLDPQGVTFFNNQTELNNVNEGINPDEILWRTSKSETSDEEEDNYPPSLFGKGKMNPSQNLVDAFPDKDGYPITHGSSAYVDTDPYANRDPRLSYYIIYNSNIEGVSDAAIFTGSDSGTDDGINVLETSTRTGYYMKKRMRMDVNYNNSNGSWQKKTSYTPRIRYTEMFLNYAEAANEAYGPMGIAPNASYSSVDVIRAIRKRALDISSDPYLDECAGDKDKMRELIQNERRLELCFEGFRFWDLRRWKEDLATTVKGFDVSTGEEFDVESRSYSDYMNYGPIPFSECLKYDKLVQNKGWE